MARMDDLAGITTCWRISIGIGIPITQAIIAIWELYLLGVHSPPR